MRKLLIPLITLLIGLGLGYQFGNFGHKISGQMTRQAACLPYISKM